MGSPLTLHLRLEKMQRAFLTALIWFTPNLIFLTILFTLAPTLTDRNRIVLPPNLQASCLCRSLAWRCSWFADSAVPVAFSNRTSGGHCQRGYGIAANLSRRFRVKFVQVKMEPLHREVSSRL